MSSILEVLAKDKGFDTLTDLAKGMGKNPATFFNNLRYFYKTKNYQSKFASDLMNTLKISTAELEQLVQKATDDKSENTALQKLVDIFENKSKQLNVLQERQFYDHLQIIDALEEGDEYSYFSRNFSEFENPLYQKAVYNAAIRGVFIMYIGYVGKVANIKEPYLGLEYAVIQSKATFDTFYRSLLNFENRTSHGNNFDDRLKFIQTSEPFLDEPYILIGKNKGEPIYGKYFCLSQIKAAKFVGIPSIDNLYIWYPVIPPITLSLVTDRERILSDIEKSSNEWFYLHIPEK